MKVCSKCKIEKSLNDFYTDNSRPDNRQSSCKDCNNKYLEEYRKTDNRKKALKKYKKSEKGKASEKRYMATDKYRETSKRYKKSEKGKMVAASFSKSYRELNPKKIKAYIAMRSAIKNKILIKRECEVCGSENSHAHHDDYDKPIDVKWMCKKHHEEWHSENGPGING